MTNVLLARTRKRYDAVSWCIDKTRKPGKRDARNSVANEKTTRNQPGCLNLSRNVVCNNSNGEFLPFFFLSKVWKRNFCVANSMDFSRLEGVNIKRRKIRRKYIQRTAVFRIVKRYLRYRSSKRCGMLGRGRTKGFVRENWKFYFQQTNCNEFSREIFFVL